MPANYSEGAFDYCVGDSAEVDHSFFEHLASSDRGFSPSEFMELLHFLLDSLQHLDPRLYHLPLAAPLTARLAMDRAYFRALLLQLVQVRRALHQLCLLVRQLAFL